jgi:3-oxoacyl-[acyl-carrier-protein] synthase III
MSENAGDNAVSVQPFFDRPGVTIDTIPIGPGVPIGIERVYNREVGFAGAYGAWGAPIDNAALWEMVESHLGEALSDGNRMSLGDLGFHYRHHIPKLTHDEDVELEVEVGARYVEAAAAANGWAPDEVDALLLGSTVPIVPDLNERIARRVGLRRDVLKVSLHKACDGGVAGLNMVLNPMLHTGRLPGRNLSQELRGKKVLVGAVEGLSRVIKDTTDPYALQLFANGAAVLGLVPGKHLEFIAGSSSEVYDEEGLLQVRMTYPHSGCRDCDGSLLEVTQLGENEYRVAGLQHEPQQGAGSVVMAGPMGMVKLFVRSGVVAVRNTYTAYRERLSQLGTPGRDIAVAIVHHANYKINQLKARQLQKEGINFPMPWLLSDFGNVSAASAMIAFCRRLPTLRPGDHVLVDGFGAGTYYDVVAVEVGGA